MKEAFIKLENEIAIKKQELQKLEAAQKAMQDICEHEYQYTGHNHNDSKYVCIVCGKVEYR